MLLLFATPEPGNARQAKAAIRIGAAAVLYFSLKTMPAGERSNNVRVRVEFWARVRVTFRVTFRVSLKVGQVARVGVLSGPWIRGAGWLLSVRL